MSRGTIILIVVLCGLLVGLLALPKLKSGAGSGTPAPAPAVAPTPVTTPVKPAVPEHPPVTPTPQTTVVAPVHTPVSRSNIAAVSTMVVDPNEATNMLTEPQPKPLPVLERDYLATTNHEARLDVMMDIAETPSAEAVKSLTRLFEAETDPELKVDLVDSLLGIEGFKDEKLIMLTMAIRNGLPGDVRQSAIDGLIDLEDNRAVPLLNGLLNDPDPEIREAAQDAIEIIQTPPEQAPKFK